MLPPSSALKLKLNKAFFTTAATLVVSVAIGLSSAQRGGDLTDDQLAWQTLAQNSHSHPGQDATAAWLSWRTADQVYGTGSTFCHQSVQNPHSNNAATHCESVLLDPVADAYASQHVLAIRENLITLASQGLQFPDKSIELKTEWISVSDSETSYVVTNRNDQRLGLVAFHLKAKVLPNHDWLWATFIHKKELSAGFETHDASDQNDAGWLTTLLNSQNATILQQYVMVGTQTKARAATNTPVLGNPLIEGLTDTGLANASCVGCHANAHITKTGDSSVPVNPSVISKAGPPALPKNPTDNDFVSGALARCHQRGIMCNDGSLQASIQ